MEQRKRLVFCTYPSLYSDIVLSGLLESTQVELVGVVCSTRILSKRYGAISGSLRQIRLSGWRYATYLWVVTDLYRLLRWLLRRPTLRGRLKRLGIPVLDTRDINATASVEVLRRWQADVMLSAHFNQLIGPEVLALPRLACINIHPSLLPEFQGVDPAFYALLRQARETGVTVHVQDEQFDHGRILEQSPLKPRWHDSLLSLNMKLFRLGVLSAVRQVVALDVDTQGSAQLAGGQYDSWPGQDAVAEFRRRYKLFRWKEYLVFIRHVI